MRAARIGIFLTALALVLVACGRVPPTSSAETPSPAESPSLMASPSPVAPLTIAGPTLPGGEVALAYKAVTYQASGGNAPYLWSVSDGALPGGLSLSPDGVLSGTPTAAGAFSFTLQVTDASMATSNVSGNIGVVPQLRLQYRPYQSYDVQNGYPFVNVCVEARADHPCPTPDLRFSPFATVSGGAAPYTHAVASGTLPPGTWLNGLALSGNISTSVLGEYTFVVRVTDSYGATASIGINFWCYRT